MIGWKLHLMCGVRSRISLIWVRKIKGMLCFKQRHGDFEPWRVTLLPLYMIFLARRMTLTLVKMVYFIGTTWDNNGTKDGNASEDDILLKTQRQVSSEPSTITFQEVLTASSSKEFSIKVKTQSATAYRIWVTGRTKRLRRELISLLRWSSTDKNSCEN